MKISVNQKRRRLLKLGSAAAILPIAGRAGGITSSPPGTTGGPSVVQSQTPNSATPSAEPGSCLVSANHALLFHYDQPAVESSIQFQGLPVGNGRLGALAGGVSEPNPLYLNEITLWSGSKDVVDPAYTTTGMGTYLSLGKLYIDLPDHVGATNYQRSLDISNSVVRTQYNVGGTTYMREIFSSFPDNVIVIRLTFHGGTYNGTVSLIGGGHPNRWRIESRPVVLGGGQRQRGAVRHLPVGHSRRGHRVAQRGQCADRAPGLSGTHDYPGGAYRLQRALRRQLPDGHQPAQRHDRGRDQRRGPGITSTMSPTYSLIS
jgi:Glycosyl hydrolase family 65, N-terminal domain